MDGPIAGKSVENIKIGGRRSSMTRKCRRDGAMPRADGDGASVSHDRRRFVLSVGSKMNSEHYTYGTVQSRDCSRVVITQISKTQAKTMARRP